MLIANQRIPKDNTIQVTAQKNAGMPVALAMFTASVRDASDAGANGEDRKKTVFRSKSALRMHCTARKLTRNEATLALANLATNTRPIETSVPATSVKGMPERAPHESRGFSNPKIRVSPKMSKPEPNNTKRAATVLRISTSSNAPKAIEPRYPALEIKTCEMNPPLVV